MKMMTRPCDNCGKSLTKPASKMKVHTYCDLNCCNSHRVRMATVTKPCEFCGQPVSRKGSHFKAHTFCGRPCYLASPYHRDATRRSNERRYPAGKTELVCPQCSIKFYLAPSQTVNRRCCSFACMKAYAIAQPVRQVTAQGYIRIFVGRGVPGSTGHGHMLEHRLMMQQHLGRLLQRHEDVHHINGRRDDNRLDNLELWSTSHPRGQRVADKLAWAREFVAQYEGTPIE